jgi:hypothetical protein
MTAVSGSVFTAAQFNTNIRDNLNETAPAKATQVSSHFVGSGVNSIVERLTDVDFISGLETTTSVAYTDLATVGPTVTATTGTRAMVFIRCASENSGAGNGTFMSFEVTGASAFGASDTFAIEFNGLSAGARERRAGMYMFNNLTPGSNTFTSKYKVSAGTGGWLTRQITVFPF